MENGCAIAFDLKRYSLDGLLLSKPFVVDSETLDERGLAIAGLNKSDEIVRLTILNTTSFLH